MTNLCTTLKFMTFSQIILLPTNGFDHRSYSETLAITFTTLQHVYSCLALLDQYTPHIQREGG